MTFTRGNIVPYLNLKGTVAPDPRLLSTMEHYRADEVGFDSEDFGEVPYS